MRNRKIIVFLVFILAIGTINAVQQDSVPADLKDAALHDAVCVKPAEGQNADAPTLSTSPILLGGRESGTVVKVEGTCHCQSNNCDTLVYLHSGDQYHLALHEKYASLHPMKIVKHGMPSLTGEFELSAQKMETTVYDWDGKVYKASLCATVIKAGKLPKITQHPCKAQAQ